MKNQELKAIEKLYESIGMEFHHEDYDRDFLTVNVCRNGREVYYYMDERISKAIYIDSLELLTDEEIEKELV